MTMAMPHRLLPHDSMGVGYFHTGVSEDLRKSLSHVFDLHDVGNVELYYNMTVMKGFQHTSDLQVIDPAERHDDTAIVVGLRGTLGF